MVACDNSTQLKLLPWCIVRRYVVDKAAAYMGILSCFEGFDLESHWENVLPLACRLLGVDYEKLSVMKIAYLKRDIRRIVPL